MEVRVCVFAREHEQNKTKTKRNKMHTHARTHLDVFGAAQVFGDRRARLDQDRDARAAIALVFNANARGRRVNRHSQRCGAEGSVIHASALYSCFVCLLCVCGRESVGMRNTNAMRAKRSRIGD